MPSRGAGGLAHVPQRPSGPVIVAVSSSLKAVPILFAAVYVVERRWTALAVTIVLTAALVAPMAWLGYDITPAPSEGIHGLSPVAWGIATLLGVGGLGILTLRRSRRVALAAGIAAFLALPRSFRYDLTLVLPATAQPRRADRAPHPLAGAGAADPLLPALDSASRLR